MDEEKLVNTFKTGYLIKRFIPYYKKYKLILFLDLFCALCSTACALALPMIVRLLTDKASAGIENITLDLVLRVGGLYGALVVVDVVSSYFVTYVGHTMGAKIETDMRRDMFEHLQTLSWSYFSETKVGQLMSRLTNDLFDITEFAHHCPEEFFVSGIKIIVAFIILANINLPLTIIIFAVIPFMCIVSIWWLKKLRIAFKKQRNQLGEINAAAEDSIQGIRVVKSFANEGMENCKFEKGNVSFLGIKRKTYKIMAGFDAQYMLFNGLMFVAVLACGSYFLMKGQITIGDFLAFLLYVVMLLESIMWLVEFMWIFQGGITGVERFIEIMDEPATIVDSPDARPMDEVKGEIRFDNVTFSYEEESELVLEKVDLCIHPGEHIALVGPSGGGKTTMCNLIPRFYDVREGRITIDGGDVKDYQLKSLRNNIGVVQQDVYLFSGSIAENIEYGKPGAGMDEIIEAAKQAGAHDFIMSFEDGYDSYVGEKGVKLSGGQKQRISIARVFLKNPPILILDEATSSLDNESEQQVQVSLEDLSKGRTTLTIAHRLTTIRNADIILVLTEEGIVESGSHVELMAAGGQYSRLYRLYSDYTSGVAVGE